jgi:hypothetical protein
MTASLETVTGLSPRLRQHTQGVRLFMRDFAELNLLIRGEESSDRMIAWATFDFVSDFNSSPPFSGYTLEAMYDSGWSSFAIRGTVVTVLQSLSLWYTRNNLPFSDGGISVNMNDKAGALMQMSSLLQSAYEQNKAKIKTALNVAQLLEPDSIGLHSDLAFLSESYGY